MEEMQATQEKANRRENSLIKELDAIQEIVPIIEVTPDGDIIEINKLSEDLFNIAGTSIKGQTIFNFARVFHFII